jgi:hypothetical protein
MPPLSKSLINPEIKVTSVISTHSILTLHSFLIHPEIASNDARHIDTEPIFDTPLLSPAIQSEVEILDGIFHSFNTPSRSLEWPSTTVATLQIVLTKSGPQFSPRRGGSFMKTTHMENWQGQLALMGITLRSSSKSWKVLRRVSRWRKS